MGNQNTSTDTFSGIEQNCSGQINYEAKRVIKFVLIRILVDQQNGIKLKFMYVLKKNDFFFLNCGLNQCTLCSDSLTCIIGVFYCTIQIVDEITRGCLFHCLVRLLSFVCVSFRFVKISMHSFISIFIMLIWMSCRLIDRFMSLIHPLCCHEKCLNIFMLADHYGDPLIISILFQYNSLIFIS